MITFVATICLGLLLGWTVGDVFDLKRDVRGLKLRVADLDRDLTALEGSLTGDGR